MKADTYLRLTQPPMTASDYEVPEPRQQRGIYETHDFDSKAAMDRFLAASSQFIRVINVSTHPRLRFLIFFFGLDHTYTLAYEKFVPGELPWFAVERKRVARANWIRHFVVLAILIAMAVAISR